MEDNSPVTETPQSSAKKSGAPVGMIAAGLVVLAVVGAVTYKINSMSSSTDSTETSTMAKADENTSTSASATPTSIQAANYKDGTYDVKGAYTSPAGPETIDVKLTLKDNKVTDAEVVSEATNPKSKFMQGAFISGYKDMVIGKNINDIHLEKVSGSSLTPKGFNDALEQIKTQAQSS